MTLPTACPKPEPRPRRQPKRINPRNEKRAVQRLENAYGPKASWVRSLASVVSGSEGTKADPIVAAHVKSRGAGGDSRDLVPMLASEHQRRHDIGELTFDREVGVDMQKAADIIEDHWLRFVKSERPEENPAGLEAETGAGFTNQPER